MASQTLIFQSIAQYKVEISDDGTVIGNPKFMMGWTRQLNAPKKAKKVKVELTAPKEEGEFLL